MFFHKMKSLFKKSVVKKRGPKSEMKNKKQNRKKNEEVTQKKHSKSINKINEVSTFNDETGTPIYSEDSDYEDDRERLRLPKITRDGLVVYDQGGEDEFLRTPYEEKSKKFQKQQLKFQKILERSKKREEQRLNKKQEKTPAERYIDKIKNKIYKVEDIKEDISTLANGIIGEQIANIRNFDVLFFIFRETLKRNQQNFINKKKVQNKTDEGLCDKQEQNNPQKVSAYLEEANILSIISICTVLKYITPSYKLIFCGNAEQGEENNEKEYMIFNGKKKKKFEKENTKTPERFSKLIKNVNNLEIAIAKYYDEFCTILKENIKHNTVVYVNLLCEIITVNLYLSKEKGLFQLLIIYANRTTYANAKLSSIANNCNIKEKCDTTSDMLCMNCLNTLSEIITNDANLFFTSHLIQHFSNFIFKHKNNVSPSLLKAFSNLNIREKKMNAKIYMTELQNEKGGKLNKKDEIELKKKNICGDLKIIEKNVDKILDELFLIYLCVLKKYTHYSSIFIKNVLYAIADYALYINKYLMDDVLEEIKVIAKNNKTAAPLRITSIHIFLKILNKIEDNIYIDCSWICDVLLYILDSPISYFSIGSCYFLFEKINFPISSFLEHKQHLTNENHIERKKEEQEEELKKYWVTEQQYIKVNSTNTKIDKQKERTNFSAELLYCIDMLLRTKNFVSNFQSTNNNILCRIIHQLYNITLHSDYVICMAILKQIQLILVKFPLVKCIIGKEGTIISFINDNISAFYQNNLLHSSLFDEISTTALDLALNDPDEKYFQAVNSYIHENNRFVKNEIIHFNLNLNERSFVDEELLMDYDPREIYKKENSTCFTSQKTNIFKKGEDILGPSFLTPDTQVIDVGSQQLPSYMLTANDFVQIVFSPIQHLMKRFQKKDQGTNRLEESGHQKKKKKKKKNRNTNMKHDISVKKKSYKKIR